MQLSILLHLLCVVKDLVVQEVVVAMEAEVMTVVDHLVVAMGVLTVIVPHVGILRIIHLRPLEATTILLVPDLEEMNIHLGGVRDMMTVVVIVVTAVGEEMTMVEDIGETLDFTVRKCDLYIYSQSCNLYIGIIQLFVHKLFLPICYRNEIRNLNYAQAIFKYLVESC
jgi:hypothetical protein